MNLIERLAALEHGKDAAPYVAAALSEMAYSPARMETAAPILARVLSRMMGTRFYQEPDPEEFILQGVHKYGVRFYYNLNSVRFNWTKQNGAEMESIDIWNGSTGHVPTVTIDVKNKNVLQMLNALILELKNPRPGMIDVELDSPPPEDGEGPDEEPEESQVLKGVDISKLGPVAQAFLKATGVDPKAYMANPAKFQYPMKQFRKGTKEYQTIVAARGRPYIDVPSSQDQKDEQEFEDTLNPENSRIDPEVLFKDLVDLVEMVASGATPSLMVIGMAGVGKTYVVIETINKNGLQKDTDYVVIKGATSAFGLYSSLYANRERLIVYDDCDSVFSEEKSINILKAALDSTAVREISWMSKATVDPDMITDDDLANGKLPSRFEFNGRIIFISNLGKNQMDSALLSRSYFIDITLNPEDVVKRIESILKSIMPEAKMAEKQEVLAHMKENPNAMPGGVNLRTFLKAVRIRRSNNPRWKELIVRYA
jgi:hypothetical protein